MVKKYTGSMGKTGVLFALLPVILLCMASGCSKENGVCFTNSGQVIFQPRTVEHFDSISLNDNVNLILTMSPVNTVQVEAGKNIILGITTEVVDNQLIIHNQNSCNWLRSYNSPINVHVSTNNLCNIMYNGSGDVRSSGILTLDSLKVEVWGGSGTIDLSLDVWKGNFSLNMGAADFRLRGVSAYTSVYAANYGLYDGRDLETRYTFITNKGSNDCYVKATNTIEITIESIGDVYYTGNPATIKENISGSGRAIPF
jgi:hypothetical protein